MVIRVQDLTPADIEIGRVTSFDRDEGDNAKIFYRIEGSFCFIDLHSLLEDFLPPSLTSSFLTTTTTNNNKVYLNCKNKLKIHTVAGHPE